MQTFSTSMKQTILTTTSMRYIIYVEVNDMNQSLMHDPDASFIKAMIPSLKDVSVPEVFEPWKMDKNPYIDPIIDIDTVYQQNKALLYERKTKTKK